MHGKHLRQVTAESGRLQSVHSMPQGGGSGGALQGLHACHPLSFRSTLCSCRRLETTSSSSHQQQTHHRPAHLQDPGACMRVSNSPHTAHPAGVTAWGPHEDLSMCTAAPGHLQHHTALRQCTLQVATAATLTTSNILSTSWQQAMRTTTTPRQNQMLRRRLRWGVGSMRRANSLGLAT